MFVTFPTVSPAPKTEPGVLLLFSRSVVSDSANAGTAAHQAHLSFTVSRSLLKFMSIESVIQSSHLILFSPFSSYPQSFPASGSFPMSQPFASRWSKYWSFSFSISPSNDLFRVDFGIHWFDLLAVQGTLKNLLQHHQLESFKFFSVQPSLWSIVGVQYWLNQEMLIARFQASFQG